MTKFLKLATFHRNGEGNIVKFFDDMGIRILNYKHEQFNFSELITVHFFATGENKLGIQLVIQNESGFSGDIGTYYNTLSRMCADYDFDDICSFYPMYMIHTSYGTVFPCTIINVNVDKFNENDGHPIKIRISAEVPERIKPYFIREINNNVLSEYYYLGSLLKQRNTEGGCCLSEDEAMSCMIDV